MEWTQFWTLVAQVLIGLVIVFVPGLLFVSAVTWQVRRAWLRAGAGVERSEKVM